MLSIVVIRCKVHHKMWGLFMLTQKRLKELIDYDPLTGVFTRMVDRPGGIKKGSLVGSVGVNGYIETSVDGNKCLLHRLAFLWMEGYLPENKVDHIDRDRQNNKWSNLREVSDQCNSRNSGLDKRSVSGVTGVTWSKRTKKWDARISCGGKVDWAGLYDELFDAAVARWKLEKKHNYPNCNTTSTAYQYVKNAGV